MADNGELHTMGRHTIGDEKQCYMTENEKYQVIDKDRPWLMADNR